MEKSKLVPAFDKYLTKGVHVVVHETERDGFVGYLMPDDIDLMSASEAGKFDQVFFGSNPKGEMKETLEERYMHSMSFRHAVQRGAITHICIATDNDGEDLGDIEVEFNTVEPQCVLRSADGLEQGRIPLRGGALAYYIRKNPIKEKGIVTESNAIADSIKAERLAKA